MPGGSAASSAVLGSSGNRVIEGGAQSTARAEPGGVHVMADANVRLTHLEDGDGHRTSFSYDATGRLASVSAPNGEQISYVWDAGGRLVERRLDSGLITLQTWFEDGSLKSRSNKIGATSLSSHTYTLDAFGRCATQSEEIGNTKSWTYSYDHLDRLTSASNGVLESYTYDIWGNRRSKTTTAGTTAYLYDAAHQLSEIRGTSDTGILTGAAVHDANGQLTKLCEVGSGGVVTKTASDCTASGTGASTLTLVWNALGHLGAATRTGTGAISETYGYDSSGRRLDKTSAGLTTHYLYDGDDIHAEWAATLSGAPAAVHVHGAGADEPLLRLSGATTSASAAQLAFVQDGLGSVVGVVSPTSTSLATNQRFDAWGNRSAGTGTIPLYGYTGREPDATGLTYYRARYYHPGIGRFVSRDPAGMADAFSAYAYVRNNPISLIDPFGWLAQLATPASQSAYPSATASDWDQPACGVGSACAQLVFPNPAPAPIAGTPGRQAMPSQAAHDSIFTTPDTRNSISGQIEGKPSSVSDPFKNLPLTTPAGIGLRVIDLILNQGAEKGGNPDFVVTPSGTAVPVSQSRMRKGFEALGFPSRVADETAEAGVIHSVPTSGGNIDIRTMEGSGHHGQRAVFTRAGTNDPIRMDGRQFPNGTPKADRRAGSHLDQTP